MWDGSAPGTIVLVETRRRILGSSDTVRLDLEIPAVPRMVSEVRRAFEDVPLPPRLLSDAQLLVTELVTNSIHHAGLRRDELIRVVATLSTSTLRVDVHDGGRRRLGPSVVAGAIRPAPGAESGWGLYLVDRLAVRWGRSPGRFWFELALPGRQEPGER